MDAFTFTMAVASVLLAVLAAWSARGRLKAKKTMSFLLESILGAPLLDYLRKRKVRTEQDRREIISALRQAQSPEQVQCVCNFAWHEMTRRRWRHLVGRQGIGRHWTDLYIELIRHLNSEPALGEPLFQCVSGHLQNAIDRFCGRQEKDVGMISANRPVRTSVESLLSAVAREYSSEDTVCDMVSRCLAEYRSAALSLFPDQVNTLITMVSGLKPRSPRRFRDLVDVILYDLVQPLQDSEEGVLHASLLASALDTAEKYIHTRLGSKDGNDLFDKLEQLQGTAANITLKRELNMAKGVFDPLECRWQHYPELHRDAKRDSERIAIDPAKAILVELPGYQNQIELHAQKCARWGLTCSAHERLRLNECLRKPTTPCLSVVGDPEITGIPLDNVTVHFDSLTVHNCRLRPRSDGNLALLLPQDPSYVLPSGATVWEDCLVPPQASPVRPT